MAKDHLTPASPYDCPKTAYKCTMCKSHLREDPVGDWFDGLWCSSCDIGFELDANFNLRME